MIVNNSLRRYGGFLFSVAGAQVVGTFLSAATFPYLVRRLGVQAFGTWSFVVAAVAFSNILANPGITAHAQQQVAARRHEAISFISDVITFRFLTGFIAALVLVFAVSIIEPKAEIRRLMWLYGVGSILLGSLSSDYLLSAMELFYARSTQMVLSQSIYACGVFTLVRGPNDINRVIIATLSSMVVSHLFGWIVLWRRGIRPHAAWHPSKWRSIMVPSVHYTLSSLMSTIYSRTGTLAVRWFLGEYSLGLYASVTRLVEITYSFVSIILGLIMPRIALYANRSIPFGRLIRLGVSTVGLITIPLTIGGMITAPELVPWVLGGKFQGSVVLFQWIAPYLLTASTASLFSGTILYALGRYRAYLVSTCVGAITSIVLCFTLIPLLGVIGACVSFVLGQLGVGISAYFLGPSETREMSKSPFLRVAMLGTLVMAIAVGVVPRNSLHPLIIVGIGSSIYVLSCWLLGKNLFIKEILDPLQVHRN